MLVTDSTYLALTLLATPAGGRAETAIAFWILSAAVYLTLRGTDRENPERAGKGMPVAAWVVPIGIFLISRLAPLVRWGWSGLGADSAAYHVNFERCAGSLASCAETPIAFLGILMGALKVPDAAMVPLAGIAVQIFLAWALYAASREFFGKNAAYWSIAIYAVSVSQFVVYWSLFLNMEIAIALSLWAMVACRRRSWWAAPASALAGIVHFVAFVPLAIALAAMTVADKNRRRYAAGVLGASLLAALAYRAPHIAGYAENAAAYAFGAYGEERALFLAGHFVSFDFYHGALMLFYLPFGIFAIAETVRESRLAAPSAYALSALALVAMRAIFHNRFIIVFDVMCIIFAGRVMERFTERMREAPWRKAAMAGVAALLAGYAIYQSARMEPLMGRTDFAELRALEGRFPGERIFVNDPVYRQFVEGWSGHPAAAGRFSEEPWRSATGPSLIYNGARSTPFEPHDDSRAKQISPRVWKYMP